MNKNSRINLRLPKEKHKWLKKYAYIKGISMTAVLEAYIDRLMKKYPIPPPKPKG